jgi:hypothetical protein
MQHRKPPCSPIDPSRRHLLVNGVSVAAGTLIGAGLPRAAAT